MVTVMSAFTWLGLRWNARWHSSSSEELQTYRALRISACLLFGWTRFEVFFIHTRQKWCRIPHWEHVLRKAGHLGVFGWWSRWLPQCVHCCRFSEVKFTCSSSLIVGIVSWWAFPCRSWDEAFSMFAAWKLADSTEWPISNNELREAVDFSRRRRRRSVVEWQCSINWSLIAFSSEYLSKSQCSPSRRSRVTFWAIDSFGAWWAWRKVCYLNWKLFWGGKCVFSAVSASV